MNTQQSASTSFAKRLLLCILIGIASLFLIRVIYAFGLYQNAEERKFKVEEFKDMPLEVQQVRNLQSDTWTKHLEIEVKNVSAKPIYFILAYLIFPDDKNAPGEVGIRLTFGKRENILIRHIAEPADPHLDPDETYVFTIPEPYRRGFEGRQKRFPDAYKNFRLDVMLVSFGDGTGWEIGQPRDKRKKTSALGMPNRLDLKKRNQITGSLILLGQRHA